MDWAWKILKAGVTGRISVYCRGGALVARLVCKDVVEAYSFENSFRMVQSGGVGEKNGPLIEIRNREGDH